MLSPQCDRLYEEPPFPYCGVDLFGSFVTKEGRKELKRYGALFTCLSRRAIHIETVTSLNTVHSSCVYADLLVAGEPSDF